MDKKIIEKAYEFSKKYFENESSGHDFQHSERVYRVALELAKEEGADLEIVALASLLHDVDDRKISPESYPNKEKARKFLIHAGIPAEEIERIVTCIKEVEFAGEDSVTPSTLEGMCVQDADRLDALGAIGIARAFAYGGAHHRKMYDKDVAPRLHMTREQYFSNTDSTTINHFYEKLLTLESLMNTKSGKRIAKERTEFMETFLEEFLKETK